MTTERRQEIEQMYALMTNFIESPNSHLEYYKEDFYTHDKNFLERTHTVGRQYVWIVRDAGTHLYPIGIHKGLSRDLADLIDGGAFKEPTLSYFLVNANELNEISEQEAARLTCATARYAYKTKSFSRQSGAVYRGNTAIATYDIRLFDRDDVLALGLNESDGNNFRIRALDYTTPNGMAFLLEGGDKSAEQEIPENQLEGLSETDCLVLEELAANLVRRESNSLFTPVGRISLNGYNLISHNNVARNLEQNPRKRQVSRHS